MFRRKNNHGTNKDARSCNCWLLAGEDRGRAPSLFLNRLFRCIYVGPMVNFFVETYYNLEILSSNMAFAVISVHSTYCQTLYFIFCIISRRLEKKFSDVRFEEQDILSKIKSTTLVLTSYCSSWSVINWPSTIPPKLISDPHDRDLATRAPGQHRPRQRQQDGVDRPPSLPVLEMRNRQ